MATITDNGHPKQNDKTLKYWDNFYSYLDSSVQSLNQSRQQTSTAKPCASVFNNCIDDDSGGEHIHSINKSQEADKHPLGMNVNSSDGKESSELEWIAPNSPLLLDEVLSLFPKHKHLSQSDCNYNDNQVNVLEIGCGVSQLSRSILERIIQMREANSLSIDTAYSFVSTDVSSVCLDHNRIRDGEFISSLNTTATSLDLEKSKRATDSLCYEILDVIDENPCSNKSSPIKDHYQKYDIILDKGTLDTFLFRSKRTKKGTSSHPPLLIPLLNNIHRFLSNGCNATYLIISPRSKIKSVRDFRGFKSVRRRVLDSSLIGDSVLVGSNGNCRGVTNANSGGDMTNKAPRTDVYLYECLKNDSYQPGIDEPFYSSGHDSNDESACPNCGMKFSEFRGRVDIRDQGEVIWARRWNGHRVHCKRLQRS